ncbi:MAG: VapC toxin family domain ribonuclease [Hydrocarboniphaga sp.]|uniref:PIN domain-containing protein n=1 Tax=Hydrocarboniphaga sp. TaxID=2033016 RepID=UPI00261BBB06|nr:PIN domain-containing protein [Hydrocarboniphaga sp.]MDB5971943.1 VapC toxin family domain ribonuclease [Hydrocarboniphaga sp.]
MSRVRYLLDTNILSLARRGAKAPNRAIALNAKLDEHHRRIVISLITLGEFHKGASLSADPAPYLRYIERMRRLYDVLPLDYEVTRHFGTVAATTQRQQIGVNDAWIAATALRHDCIVVTNNVREFARVPGLAIEDWTR